MYDWRLCVNLKVEKREKGSSTGCQMQGRVLCVVAAIDRAAGAHKVLYDMRLPKGRRIVQRIAPVLCTTALGLI